MYTLQLDQEKLFECHLKIQGTSLKKSKVSLVIERNDGVDVRFRGDINEDGKVNIQIKRLNNILNEGDTGVLYLEVVADNVYFVPFKSEYATEVARKVTIEKPLVEITNKPTALTVELIEPFSAKTHVDHVNALLTILRENKLNIFNKNSRVRAMELIAEYIVDNHITDTKQANTVINNLLEKVARTTTSKSR